MLFPKRFVKQFPRYWWLILVIGAIVFYLVTFLLAEGLWFAEVNYLDVFSTRLWSQIALVLFPFGISLGVLWGNLSVAHRNLWLKPVSDRSWSEQTRFRSNGSDQNQPALPGRMSLIGLLTTALVMSGTIGLMLLHHGQLIVSYWRPDFDLYSPQATLPLWFRPETIGVMLQSWSTQFWQPALVAGVAVLLLIYPRWLLRAITVLASLSFGLVLSEQWTKVLLALHPVLFTQADPLFDRDIGFFVFILPLWELFAFWLLGISLLAFLVVGLTYLLSGDSLSQGYFPGFASAQQRHLFGLGGFFLLAIALGCWLERYALLYSAQGVVYGATYTNVAVELPAYTLLSGLSLGLAAILFWRVIFWSRGQSQTINQADQTIRQQEKSLRRWRDADTVNRSNTIEAKRRSKQRSILLLPSISVSPLLFSFILYAGLAIVIEFILPPVFQRVVVQPNELQLEQPFIQRTIALTRQAFNLETIAVETFDPQNNLTQADIEQNELTVNNIRLWDTRPLLETNRQLQRIRLYYEFPDADIDRYTLPTAQGEIGQQQVLIAARELDYRSVPTAAQTWINKHLIYTHGYGFTMSPVNVAGEGGLPDYLVGGIEPVVVDSRVQDSIPIGKPRIYYGEITDTYVMTQTRVQELDYPSGSDNVYNVYDGRGGVSIGNLWQRLLFAKHMGDWRMLLTDDFTAQTRLLFRRNIKDRVRTIAPFLRYDSNPYLVVANTGDKSWQHNFSSSLSPTPSADQSYLYWIIDAYTVSDRYPYADPSSNDFNYIRNSVKVVIDAFHGSVNFYVADDEDPIIKSWQSIFPNMFQPLSEMPDVLRVHIRYAPDLYRVQSNELMTYHMTDPIVFYNREDQWRAPNEIYGNQTQLVEPYYLIMNLPTTRNQEEFILLRPFTPVQRNNLIAWLAGRSDGDEYGTMLLYTFPKQTLIYGPEQIEARINQDPVISQQISLWNRQGSRALQGNLLVIPIEQSLLYVEPLYLEAEQNSLPILARVIVAYGSRIVMAETLEEALDAVFQPPPSDAPIIRPVDEGTIPSVEEGLVP